MAWIVFVVITIFTSGIIAYTLDSVNFIKLRLLVISTCILSWTILLCVGAYEVSNTQCKDRKELIRKLFVMGTYFTNHVLKCLCFSY